MTLLLIGLAMFLVPHLLPSTPLRAPLAAAVGEKRYKGIVSLVSLASIVVIVIGYRQVPPEYLFAPKEWARAAALHSMPIAFILMAAANMPTHIRQWVRHPLSLGLLIWALLHYFANGEKAAVWLFGSFAIYGAVAIVSGLVRGQSIAKPGKVVAWKYDIMAIAGGLILYAVILHGHGWLFNRALIG